MKAQTNWPRIILRAIVFIVLAIAIIVFIATGGKTTKTITHNGHQYIETYSFLSKGYAMVHDPDCPVEKNAKSEAK